MAFEKVMDFMLDKVVPWLTAALLIGLLCLIIMVFFSKPLMAAPVVIHDTGTAQPIDTILPELKPELPKQLTPSQPQGDPGAAFMAGLFPVRTKTLSPGIVEARAVTLNVTQPFFLVGYDPSSLEWLNNYCPRLKEIRASGLVVAAKNLEQFNTVHAICPGLPMTPINGDGMAKELGIDHYPVLVSGRRIEQ